MVIKLLRNLSVVGGRKHHWEWFLIFGILCLNNIVKWRILYDFEYIGCDSSIEIDVVSGNVTFTDKH